jgi:Sulfatase
VHTHSVNFDVYSRLKDILFPLVRLAIVFVAALLIGLLGRKRIYPHFGAGKRWPLRTLAGALTVILIVLTAGVVYYGASRRLGGTGVAAREVPSGEPPNIVLITMDTVRADHLSIYGYRRDTTPNLARLAEKGVLFENAISPSS